MLLFLYYALFCYSWRTIGYHVTTVDATLETMLIAKLAGKQFFNHKISAIQRFLGQKKYRRRRVYQEVQRMKSEKNAEGAKRLLCTFGVTQIYSTTIAVLDGSPSPALLTAMMRYSDTFSTIH